MELPLADVQIHNNNEDLQTYTYARNRQFRVKVGTRCASAVLRVASIHEKALRDAARRNTASKAQDVAAILWEARWGDLPWDRAQFLVTHTRARVAVELRIEGGTDHD